MPVTGFVWRKWNELMGKQSEMTLPADFKEALGKLKATFEKLSPSHRREYVRWIAEAKLSATRQRRIAAAVKMIAAGKKSRSA